MNNAGFRSRPLTSHQSVGLLNEKKPKYSRESLNFNNQPRSSTNQSSNVRIANYLTSMKATGLKLSPSSTSKMMIGSANMIFTPGGIGLDFFSSGHSKIRKKDDESYKKTSPRGISRLLSGNKSSGDKFYEFSEKRDSERRKKENNTGHNFVKNSSNSTKETAKGNKINSRELNNESFLTPRKSAVKEETKGRYGPIMNSKQQDEPVDMEESSGEEISVND